MLGRKACSGGVSTSPACAICPQAASDPGTAAPGCSPAQGTCWSGSGSGHRWLWALCRLQCPSIHLAVLTREASGRSSHSAALRPGWAGAGPGTGKDHSPCPALGPSGSSFVQQGPAQAGEAAAEWQGLLCEEPFCSLEPLLQGYTTREPVPRGCGTLLGAIGGF